jgi:hypothetical protein
MLKGYVCDKSIVFGVMHKNLGLQIISCWVLSWRGCLSKKTRIRHGTIKFLYKKLDQFSEKINIRTVISVETRILASLYRFGTGNGFLLFGEVYGIVECMASCIVREFCKAVEKHLLRVLTQFPSEGCT